MAKPHTTQCQNSRQTSTSTVQLYNQFFIFTIRNSFTCSIQAKKTYLFHKSYLT